MADHYEINRYYDALPGGVFAYKADDSERIIYANEEVVSIFGCADFDEFVEYTGGTFSGMIYPDDYENVHNNISEQRKVHDNYFEHISYRIRSKNGDVRYVEEYGRLSGSEAYGDVYLAFIVSISNKNNTYVSDPLTGLIGMRHFLDAVNEKRSELLRNGIDDSYALFHLNISKFKMYNTAFGLEAGDECLKSVADILSKEFEGGIISRFSADIFVAYVLDKDLEERLIKVRDAVRGLSETVPVNIKVGIRRFGEGDREITALTACDQAKMASDSIRDNLAVNIIEFNSQLKREYELRSYISRNLDKAIASGYIQIYYQPVVRTLTGKMCSMEALTRWIDPTYGFLSPAVFIPILEQENIIHKLDHYVIEQACKDLRRRMDEGVIVAPVSINFSRMDFLVGQPFETLEEMVERYHISRNLICCEITESTLMADKVRMKEEIDRLHKYGYEVWMDDFGSGYSTLNILKEFTFDEIKIDMMFLRNLNDQGKEILRSIVSMAKRLGIHTLTEGAETEEEVEFLKTIGCERIQGYYYGKPMAIEDTFQHCRDFGIEIEETWEKGLMCDSGLEDINITSPVALIYDDGVIFKTLCLNDAFLNELSTIGIRSFEDFDSYIGRTNSYYISRFRQYSDKARSSGEAESFTYVEHGEYISVSIKTLAIYDERSVHRFEMINATHSDEQNDLKVLDGMTRQFTALYSDVYLLDAEQDEIRILSTSNIWEKAGDTIKGIVKYYREFAKENIHPKDIDDYIEFVTPANIYDKVDRSGKNFVTQSFRVRRADGIYRWVTAVAAVGLGIENSPIMILQRDDLLNSEAYRKRLVERLADSLEGSYLKTEGDAWDMDGELWRNLISSSPVCYFWKDKYRRFMGASQSFLDAYGIKHINEIYGKTDEEVGWHIDEDPYRNDECRVLSGERVIDSIGKCMIKGELKTITASKIPIYRDGEIIGLLGYFRDLERDTDLSDDPESMHYIDPLTGMLNYSGLINILMQFDDNYRKNGQNFISVIAYIPTYDEMRKRYGDAVGEKLLRKVAGILRSTTPLDAVVAHMDGARFVMLDKMADIARSREMCEKSIEDLRNIHDIDGYKCDISMHYSYTLRSETQSIDSMMGLLFERLGIAEKINYARDLYALERINLEREKFDDTDLRIVISDPLNYDLYYINKMGLREAGLPEDYDYSGCKCYKLINGYDAPCDDCPNARLNRSGFYSWNNHNPKNGKDYVMKDTLIPWDGRSVKFSISFCLQNYMNQQKERDDYIYREKTINDMIRQALCETSPEAGIRSFLDKIGREFDAERVHIFEEKGDWVTSETYSWGKDRSDSYKEKMSEVSSSVTRPFFDSFDRASSVVIRSHDDLEGGLEELKDTFINEGIERSVIVALRRGVKTIGFLGVDNPNPDKLDDLRMALEFLAPFIIFLLRSRDIVRKMDTIGFHDSMTGVMNRRALAPAFEAAKKDGNYIVIYGDVNGLKKINDTMGHDAGDELIKSAARIMSNLMGADNVYRIGGDEFLIVKEILPGLDADCMIRRLRESLDQEDISVALGCVVKSGSKMDVNKLLKEADRRMYLNKQYMHHQKSAEEKSV
ncbi:MAG: EAL domain-containing protein [Lachnospiraceae bacterium]|nr:EAL domain-containing protein [Lachnospiraceae bacterium]